MKHRAAPTLMLALLLGTALAQSAKYIDLNLTQNAVTTATEDGKKIEKFSPVKTVAPGDVISYVVTVKNVYTKPIRGVRVPLNVPKNTTFLTLEKTVDSAATEYSIDGGKTFAPAPLKKTVTVTENGKTVTREVEVKPSEYTTVRYLIPELAAGKTLKLGFRAQVK